MIRRRAALAAIGLGVVGSQAGHLLAYQVRFGAAAQHVQSTGAHSYFPLVARTSLGLAAAALLAGVFLVALARVLTGRRVRTDPQPSYVGLLAAMFTIQLVLFSVQEVVEAMVAGSSAGSAPQLLLWGTLGQLPVAAIAALALRWLAARVEAAVAGVREILTAALRVAPMPASLAVPVYTAPDRALLMSRVACSQPSRRGPPSSMRLSAV